MSDQTQAPETPSEPTPEEQRAAQATAQNLDPEAGAVPEQRPQASQQTDPSESVSDLTKRMEEAGHSSISISEPMPQEAYDRASSNAQLKQSAKESVSEALMVGNKARATKGVQEGRVFAITRVLSFQTVEGLVNRLAGAPEQLYSHPKEVEATAIGDERDGERLILNVEDDGLVKLNESFTGSRAGRAH